MNLFWFQQKIAFEFIPIIIGIPMIHFSKLIQKYIKAFDALLDLVCPKSNNASSGHLPTISFESASSTFNTEKKLTCYVNLTI